VQSAEVCVVARAVGELDVERAGDLVEPKVASSPPCKLNSRTFMATRCNDLRRYITSS
jgi:hypothetical protein